MSDIICGYTGDREAMLMAYLYDEITPADRAAFETHLASCARCRVERTALGGVRVQLERWSPPSFVSARQPAVGQPRAVVPTSAVPPAARDDGRSAWRDVPAWARAAAAVLVLGAAAGIANFNVHYDAQNGLTIHTGWAKPGTAPLAADDSASNTASREELAKLELQLRSEIRSIQASAVPAQGSRVVPASPVVRSAASSDADAMRQIKALVAESERRQQNELALRVAELMREVNSQRQADLRRIDQNLGLIQNKTGVEVMRNRQMIDVYLQRASQRQ